MTSRVSDPGPSAVSPSLDEIPGHAPCAVLVLERGDGLDGRSFLFKARIEQEDHVLSIRCARKGRGGRRALQPARFQLTKQSTRGLNRRRPLLLGDRALENACGGIPARFVSMVVDKQ